MRRQKHYVYLNDQEIRVLLKSLIRLKNILVQQGMYTDIVDGWFLKLYLYTAIAPVPLSAFAGEPIQNIGVSFIKSYAAVCLEGAIIVLGCIIFSLFAATPPVIDSNAAAVSMVWSYIGELVFNMLMPLSGRIKYWWIRPTGLSVMCGMVPVIPGNYWNMQNVEERFDATKLLLQRNGQARYICCG